MKYDFSAAAFRRFISEKDDEDVMRIRYCYQLGLTFVHLNLMEDAIISAMMMCEKVKVANKLGEDAPEWEKIKHKTTALHSSTLGSLISILERHEISELDIRYLRWVKEKRDVFTHRLFRGGGWPGEVGAEDCVVLIRRMAYLEAIFYRASLRIWKIFGRAGLLIVKNLGPAGLIMMNHNLFDGAEDTNSEGEEQSP